MQKIIDVIMEDGTAKPMTFRQDGFVPIAMKRIFRRDFLSVLTEFKEIGEAAILENMDKVSELAYAMFCRGENVDLMTADSNSYIEWISSLDANAITMISGDIVALYMKGLEATSAAKKAAAQPSGA